MISTLISATIETTAYILRHRKRKEIQKQIDERIKYHQRYTVFPPQLYYPTTRNIKFIINELKSKKDKSAIVVLDCKLELCNSEKEISELYLEAKRVSGAKDLDSAKDLFIITIQNWSKNRINLDPKVRYIITKDPKLTNLELRYKPFGNRKTVLADIKNRNRNVRTT